MESATATTERSAPERVIERPGGWSLPDLRELWDRRDLVFFLAHRDVAIRYKQAVVGVFWAILQPVLYTVVFAVFFGLLAKVASAPGIPYPLFVASGFVMWIYISQSLQESSLSTVASSALISKVYFPRLAIPVAALVPSTVDFLAGFVVVVLAAFLYGFDPTFKILLLPALVVLTMATVLGAGLWLSALNVKYRDIVMLVPFITQIGLFLTPVVYPIDLIRDLPNGENLVALYLVNPAAGIIELYRWMVLPTEFPGMILAIPIAVSIVLLVTGAMYFKRAERDFADVI